MNDSAVASPGHHDDPAAPRYLAAATARARRHEHDVLVAGSFALGVYLVAKGAAKKRSRARA